MAMEDGAIIGREDFKQKIDDLLNSVADHVTSIKKEEIDSLLDTLLRKCRVWVWGTDRIVQDAYKVSDRWYPAEWRRQWHSVIIWSDNILYNEDLSFDAIINRYKTNPDDPILRELKKYYSLHTDGEKIYSLCPSTKFYRIERHFPGKFGGHDRYIDITVPDAILPGYEEYSFNPYNQDQLAGGASIRDLLKASYERIFSDEDVSFDVSDLPEKDSVLEDSKMNDVFKKILATFSRIRNVAIQKQLSTDWGMRNIGDPIDLSYIKNLKDPGTFDAIIQDYNEDSQVIDNDGILQRINEIYEVWKNLPKKIYYLSYCHSSCHRSCHGSRGW